MEWGLVPAVPVPFRGAAIDLHAQRAYARWMSQQAIAGVAVWAHTGRGPHLSEDQRRVVLQEWRAALPGKTIVAGANGPTMARDAKRYGADALLALPRRDNPVVFHDELSQELPVIAFYLYAAAGGTDYNDRTLHDILALPGVIGIKVATLDSVMTFQRIAAVMREHPDKLLITGEDRFLGYSLMMGARAALIGMAAALTDIQAKLLEAKKNEDNNAFLRLTTQLDAFGAVTFTAPVEGYIRRMLWALAADGVIPDVTYEDPWGPTLPPADRDAVRRAVREIRGNR
ncbi:MAG TPA: dihydrodipicolinate synthase family protein [Gemmatimonadales bacterium]|nr:dihydrodipicolinate synthase family protein [Gemmatimonadales bacterium]